MTGYLPFRLNGPHRLRFQDGADRRAKGKVVLSRQVDTGLA